MSFGRGRGRGAGTANVSNIPSAMQQQLQEPERATNDSQLTQAIPRSSGSFNRGGGTIGGRGGGRGGGGSHATGANAVNMTNFQQPNLETGEQISFSMRGGRGDARGGGRGGRSAGNFEHVRENARNDNDEFRAIGGTTHNDVAARIVPGAPTASTASRYVPPTRSLEDLYKEDNDHQNYYMEIPGGDMEVAISGPGVEKQLQFDEWTEMNLHPKLMENIVEHSKYMRPRKIQSRAIPYILEGYDIKALAETGSGKTGAFMIPIIQKILFAIGDTSNQQRLSGKPTPLVIIIEPTRELCLQVYDQGRKFANEIDVKVCKAYGQYNFGNNMGELRAGCHILCATTGRLKHLIGQHMIDVSKVSYFVLDEADEMLKNNFLDDVREIIENPEFPKKEQRQTMLFSATFPYEIQELANEVLRPNYVMAALVKYHSVSVNPRVRQQFVQVDNQHKADLLKELLEKEQKEAEEKNPADPNMRRTLVFVQTRRDADRLALYLCENNIKASTINGDRTQQERELALRDFRIGKVYVLVATDVCARGIDIKDLDHVINYDLPTTFIIYTHRIGRTGRVKLGDATSFVEMNKDGSLITEIIKTLREIGQPVPDFMTGGASNAKFPPTTGLPENGFGINALPTKDDFGFANKVVVADDFGFGREHLPAGEFGSNTLAGVAFNDNANKPGISSSDEWGTTDHGWN